MKISKSFFKNYLKLSVSIFTFVLLFSCAKNNSSNDSTDPQGKINSSNSNIVAVIATAASDYSSGAHSIINYTSPRSSMNDLLPTV
ncbi:MAG: hypothetical protein WCQ47_05275, partial [bacterium]